MFIPATSYKQTAIVESLAREIWTEHYTPIIGGDQVAYMLAHFQSQQAITDQIRAGAQYFLIEENDEFIGYFAVEPKGKELLLSKIYVKHARRGKGYGRKAVHFVGKLARERHLARIVLTVNKNNPSVNVYEKLGFKNTGALVQDIGGGFVMDDYKMEKNVLQEGTQ
jgi:GNAT superfamily N-acetyltransferase